ncbi:MAG: light-harvesting antenna LH1, alpha subunit [Granulosicoccus sp.]
MWRIWLLFDPRRALVGMAAFLFTLAIVIHFIVLSTDRFNWIEGPSTAVSFQDVIEADVDTTRLG